MGQPSFCLVQYCRHDTSGETQLSSGQMHLQVRFRRHSTHVPNLTDELSTAKERRLNQFGAAVLVWCGKSVKFDRVCRTFVELNLGSTHGAPSESDVAPVSLQRRPYSIRFGRSWFGTWEVRRLNQASLRGLVVACHVSKRARDHFQTD